MYKLLFILFFLILPNALFAIPTYAALGLTESKFYSDFGSPDYIRTTDSSRIYEYYSNVNGFVVTQKYEFIGGIVKRSSIIGRYSNIAAARNDWLKINELCAKDELINVAFDIQKRYSKFRGDGFIVECKYYKSNDDAYCYCFQIAELVK